MNEDFDWSFCIVFFSMHPLILYQVKIQLNHSLRMLLEFHMELQIILTKIVMEIQLIGATTGCHCHFTVRKDGEYIDPLEIVKKKEEFI